MTMPPPDSRPELEAEEPLDAETALALLDDQRRSVEGQLAGFVPVIVTTWGIAWLVGFLSLWLIEGLAPGFSLPMPIAAAIFIALLAAAIAVSAVLGIRSGRGLRGNPREAFAGIVYGCTWTVGSLAIAGFGGALHFNGMSQQLANIFYPVAFVQFAGIMYIFAAALWRAIPMLILGVWTLVVAVVAPFFGQPTHYLVLSLGGGLGFLALGIASFVYLHRMRARVARRAGGHG